MYYQKADGTFIDVKNGGIIIYYLGRGSSNGNTTATPFPPGFRMLSGSPGLRAYNNSTMTYGDTQNAPRRVADRVSWKCIDYAMDHPETPGFPSNMTCPQGLRAQVQFQSCWDGVNLYKSDQSHVAYLSQIDNGVCPPTHPVLLPHLFYESYYNLDSVDTSDGGRFLLATGDTTGFGYHGDFLNGWNMDTQSQAIASCLASSGSGQISDCPALVKSNDDASQANCPLQPSWVNETVQGNLNALPGCNPPTSGPATAVQQNCPGQLMSYSAATGGRQTPVANSTTAVLASGSSATYAGCFVDGTAARAMTGASYSDSSRMSTQACGAFCQSKGFNVFGTEYASECYCSNSVPVTGAAQTDCSMICNGDLTSYCGGSSRLSVWTVAASSAVTTTGGSSTTTSTTTRSTTTLSTSPSVSSSSGVAGASYLGCYTDSTSSRALSGYYNSANSQTLNTCAAAAVQNGYKYFGVEYSGECFAGNIIASSSTAGSKNCNMPCYGNSSQICGGPNAISMFQNLKYVDAGNKATVTAGGKSWSYSGCWTDSPSNRALGAYAFTNSTGMSIEVCATACAQRGYSWMGTEYAAECYCGTSAGPANGAAKVADTDCTMRCAGDNSEWCGAGNRLTVYKL